MSSRRGRVLERKKAQQRRGILFVISGPSGVGKTSLCRQVVAAMDDVTQSVSYTTRLPRATEQNGREYHFVSRQAFEQYMAAGALLEWAEVHGSLYGTSRQQIETITRAGTDVLLAIDVQGAAQLRAAAVDAVFVFLVPPSWEVLNARLQQRGSEAAEVQTRRLAVARQELAQYTAYDYVVDNDQLARAVKMLRTIIVAERHRVARVGTALVEALLTPCPAPPIGPQ